MIQRATAFLVLASITSAHVSAQESAPGSLRCITVNASNECTLYNVSMIALIANPETYHGKPVLLAGYVHLEFEGDGIYLHKEDLDKHLYSNGLWISFVPGASLQGKCDNAYAMVEGIFNARSHGHMGLWSGSLDKVTRCIPWD